MYKIPPPAGLVRRPTSTRPIVSPLLASIGLLVLFPLEPQAATATGGTKTTMVLKYYPTGSQWVMRVDPPDVESFQLHFQFDPLEAAAMGIDLRNPFGNLAVDVDGNNIQVSGSTASLISGDVDIFEVRFNALPPVPPALMGGLGVSSLVAGAGLPGNEKPLDQIKFTAFGTGNDFIVVNDGGVRTRLSAAEIGASSRAATPGGVAPLVWDNGVYNDGVMGGSGPWDTVTSRFDNLPRGIANLPPGVAGEPLANVAWNNTINMHDIAAFGGIPGTGVVTLDSAIMAGGLQFDEPGYSLQGTGDLTLSRPPGSMPTIDTGENAATVNVPLSGSFQKLGPGTLTLGTLGTIGGPAVGAGLSAIQIRSGTVATEVVVADATDQAILDLYSANPPGTTLTFSGNGTFEYEARNLLSPGDGNAVLAYGALAFNAGDGQVRSLAESIRTGLNFSGLTIAAGATGNLIVSGGINGVDNRINVPGPLNQLLSPRLYFNGADYAAKSGNAAGNFVRALNYGADANAAPVNVIAQNTHVKLTATPPVQPGLSLRTLNLTGGANLNFGPGQVLTLTQGGLLVSGGASTLNASGLTTGGPAELVIRTNLGTDTLTIAAPILNSTTGGLTKSGAGTLILAGNNGYSGPTTINDGRVLVMGANGNSPIVLQTEATLGGIGSVGPISGAGTVSPGGNPGQPGLGVGILTAPSIDPTKETDLRFDIGETGTNYGPSNDLLFLNGPTPFLAPFCATSRILFDLQLPALTNGLTFVGGFFVPGMTDYTALVKGAAFVSTLNGGRVPDGFGVFFHDLVPQTIAIGGASVTGLAMQLRVAAPKVLTVNGGAWATGANWFTPGIPTATDNAVIQATGTIDIRGSSLGGQTEIQDLSFTGAATTTLTNNSTSQNMLLVLNGGRGPGVPLIQTNANVQVTIVGVNAATTPRTLTLQLNTSGEILVEGTGRLDLNAALVEGGALVALTKTGPGILALGGQNNFNGGVTVNGGTFEVANVSGAGTGAIVANAGTRLATRNLTVNNPVTLHRAELATRTGDLGTFAGPVDVAAPSTAVLRSYTTPANDQSITISGVLSGASPLTVSGNATNAAGAKALILTNPGNTFSGGFNVALGGAVRSAAVGGAGSTLGANAILLNGGAVQVRDNGFGGSTILYGNDVTVGTGGGRVDVSSAGAGANSTVQFGTLSIGAATLTVAGADGYGASFGATTLTGNATFNPTTAPLELAGPVSGAFGLTKVGPGTLILSNSNTYGGLTNVDAGTLALTGSIPATPRIDVKTGATLDVSGNPTGLTLGGAQTLSGSGAVNGQVFVNNGGTILAGDANRTGTLTFSNLVFGGPATVGISIGTSSVAVTAPNGLAAFGPPGSVGLNLAGPTPPLGQSVLIDYAGGLGGAGFGAFGIVSLPPRTLANLVDNVPNSSIDVNVTGTDFPIWTGAMSSQWSTAPIPNWVLNSNGAPTNFLTGDSVLFDDTATNTTVDVSVANVSPVMVRFNNSTQNYTVTGSRAITGLLPFIKDGTATVTLNNTNSFTGSVTLNAGTVRVDTLADSGVNSALGAGGEITFNGGTLEFTGVTASTNRPLALDVGGGTVATNGTLTLTGPIDGVGALTKAGSGTVSLAGPNSTTAGTVIAAGTLVVAEGGSLGTGPVTNLATLTFDRTTTLTVNNTIDGPGVVTKLGSGLVALGGPEANTFTGTTTVAAGTLLAAKPAGVNALGGDLVIAAGATFRYNADNVSNQLPDTATVTLNGGTFGDPLDTTPANPGATDTIANLVVNSGAFGSGRNVAAFTITGQLQVNGGSALAQRGGAITAQSVQIGAGGAVNLDGGSTTVLQESRLTVGAGGLMLADGTINLNAGPSAVTATSVGSIVTLGGNVTSTGASELTRQNAALSVARVDLDGGTRTFNVTGDLDIGSATAPIEVNNGGIVKTGSGTLTASGDLTLTSLTITAGVFELAAEPPAPAPGPAAGPALDEILVSLNPPPLDLALDSFATTDTSLVLTVPEPGALSLLAAGVLSLVRRPRRRRG